MQEGAEQEGDPQQPSLSQTLKQHRAGSTKRLVGRPQVAASTTSLTSASQSSLDMAGTAGTASIESSPLVAAHPDAVHTHPQHRQNVVSQVRNWLHEEKARRALRKATAPQRGSTAGAQRNSKDDALPTQVIPAVGAPARRDSGSSTSSDALQRLERILNANLDLDEPATKASQDAPRSPRPTQATRRVSSKRLIRRSTTASSDTDYFEGDAIVPSCDVVLDNSRTLSYNSTASTENLADSISDAASGKERDWRVFKCEIVRLAHTLRVKGWRSVPLDRGGDIEVERLSGALTNAVYVVSPPKDVRIARRTEIDPGTPVPTRAPPKLLLRIYGPQVEQLIDRGNELSILRRLARKKIGPRLLGTFRNGRFEQFFYAHTLSFQDLRMPDTSKQIAKRMRELHDGIELLDEERESGPFVWRNWDKWVARSGEVVSHLDRQVRAGLAPARRSGSDAWKEDGLLCGVEWPVFRDMVERYRRWLDEQYGGNDRIREQLVFAHNDTQYGNLLRLQPSGESPLLLPANEHKQLVVIDFEYASANLPGLEFANHFTEWCYNYHDSTRPFSLMTRNYPTLDEQRRFIKAYVDHTSYTRPSMTPGSMVASPGPSHSISAFMLDSRASASQLQQDESQREQWREKEIARYLKDARLWRVANSAQWVAWGVVQAKVSGLDDSIAGTTEVSTDKRGIETEKHHDKRPEGLVAEALLQGKSMPHEEDDEEEFDYLSYAHERAMFFWGDVLQLGVVSEDELPRELLDKVKIVDY